MHIEGSLYVSNSRILDNYAGQETGGIRICCGAIAKIYNTTIAGNGSANGPADAFHLNGGAGNLIVKNSILWNDGINEISFDESSDPWSLDIEYSTIKNGQDGIQNRGYSYLWGDGNISADPLLDGGYTLSLGSPSIDSKPSSLFL